MLLASLAWAQDPEEAPEPPVVAEEEDPLSPYRARFDVLTERAIGTTSVPVEFNWRRTNVHVAATGSFLFELNNFDSARLGGMARFPSNALVVELGLSYAHVWDTPSSQLIALTPFRQPGRPKRMELDFNVALPLAEGVVTAVPRLFPAVQMVFNAYVGARYSIYPTGFAEMKPGRVATAIISPALLEEEIANLEDARLDGMAVDPGRYNLMLGVGNDLYFKQGLFISPRMSMAVPLLAPASQTQLYVWADLSLAIGMAL